MTWPTAVALIRRLDLTRLLGEIEWPLTRADLTETRDLWDRVEVEDALDLDWRPPTRRARRPAVT